jgi:hypothetical protein
MPAAVAAMAPATAAKSLAVHTNSFSQEKNDFRQWFYSSAAQWNGFLHWLNDLPVEFEKLFANTTHLGGLAKVAILKLR